MLAARLDVIGSDNLLLVFLCPQQHYGGLESCHEAEEEEVHSPSSQPCVAAPCLPTVPGPRCLFRTRRSIPLNQRTCFVFLRKRLIHLQLGSEQIICLRTGEEDPAMDAFRFGFDPNWPQAFKSWGSARLIEVERGVTWESSQTAVMSR